VLLREAGLEAAGGFRTREFGHADPYRLALGFAAAAAKRKAAIFEHSPVRRLRAGRDHVEVVLSGGTIAAGTVIVATGEPTALHASLARHFKQEERYVVITEPVSAAMRKVFGRRAAAVVDAGAPPQAWWWTPGDRLVVSGGDQARTPEKGRDKVWVQRTGQLMYDLLRMYPAMAGLMPAYGWDVPLARSADEVMVAGPHRNFPRQLFAWGGSHDPAHAFLASQILVRHVRGEATKADSYFSFTRG
jgi:gamma-glutamylputrescine oxidase